MFSSTRRALMQRLFPALEGLIYARFLFLDLTGRGAAGNGLKYLGIVLCAVFAWYQARGGGSPEMIQGFVAAGKSQIEAVLREAAGNI